MLCNVFARRVDDRKKAFASRVWLDGVEVTHDCQIADDVAGIVLLLKRDADGRHYRDTDGELAHEWKHGAVVIGGIDVEP